MLQTLSILLSSTRISIYIRVVERLGKELFGCLRYGRIPWLGATGMLYHPKLQFLLVPVYRAVGSPCSAVSKPGIFGIFYRSSEAEGVARHVSRTGGAGQDALHGFFLEDAYAVFAQAEVHQHLVELELVGSCGPKAGSG